MEKKLVIERLLATAAKLRELPSKNFNYDHYVSEFDYENQCGTVCCVAGWYPKWFPESGLIWDDGALRLGEGSFYNIDNTLRSYHGFSFMQEIFALFYGDGLKGILPWIKNQHFEPSPSEIAERFEALAEYINDNDIVITEKD